MAADEDPQIKTLKLLLWRLGVHEEIELSPDAFPTVKVANLIDRSFCCDCKRSSPLLCERHVTIIPIVDKKKGSP